MKKKSIFLSLIIVLLGALVLVCRQMTGVSEENASEESVVSEENASEQSAVSEENATKESKVAKKLPRDSKVFLSFFTITNTFFFFINFFPIIFLTLMIIKSKCNRKIIITIY